MLKINIKIRNFSKYLIVLFLFVAVFNFINSTSVESASIDVAIPPAQGQPVNQILVTRAKTALPWYIIRASGIIAAIFLFLLILSGVGLITGTSFRFLDPLNAWATHKAMGIAFGVSVAIHGLSILLDKYVPFSITQVLIPFSSHYRPIRIFGHNFGSLGVTLGILAFYLLLAIILSSFFLISKKPHTWKAFHILAYLVLVLVFFHALLIGTDLMGGIFRTIWIIVGSLLLLVILYRLTILRKI